MVVTLGLQWWLACWEGERGAILFRSSSTIAPSPTGDGGRFVGGASEGGSPWEEVPNVKVEEEPF
ncbi:hypothetical protein DEO72_LG8g1136 [Vigna unguiculata]|uniref:Uncharacterized protein n=1 Tax=Vigna unguiculata TaxID=3917 RepID=A0A4D6MTC0_VIGUN|nr:hypothetical protein DEO72_LG8g1136 [Vigna unguiculata]